MSKKVGGALIIGAIAGFVSGIFMAPKKGTELREDAKKKVESVKENPKDVLHGTIEGIKGKVSEIKEELAASKEEIEAEEEDIVISKSFDEEEGDNE